eukprot:TRINITY_DN372_c0_g1_i9.p1 TRINITY_DN372_c0_g1~~TRINITY_DN372_c0_g1_i9.p1  ORF type:complete len:100 (-),score=30.90 TRINITY_DN372_c0_g1_i9:86-385(-)
MAYIAHGLKIQIKSHHGNYLRADTNLTVNLTQVANYLRADTNLTVNLTQVAKEWEQWTVQYVGNKVQLRSHHGTYLRADPNTSVNLAKEPKEWEQWTIN